jgi:hypothetical protein
LEEAYIKVVGSRRERWREGERWKVWTRTHMQGRIIIMQSASNYPMACIRCMRHLG